MSGYVDCPQCDARGEVLNHVNEWGKAETKDCPTCGGTGEVRADVAMDYLERMVSS